MKQTVEAEPELTGVGLGALGQLTARELQGCVAIDCSTLSPLSGST